MPEYSMRESIITSLNAQEPWPENVKLFQPYEVEQILLPDNASCLAVQAFLKMCNLPFEVEMRWNAEWMSPSGRVPFIKCGAFVVSELEPIVQFAANKGVSLCSRLTTEDKAEMRAYMSLITNVLVNAELYISWVDNETFNTVTKVRNSSVYPWPLGWIQTRAKRNQVAKRLKALHWYDKTLEQVLADVEQCCNSLSQRLGDKDYFFGTATPLDALVYGHVRALLAASGPKATLFIKPITSSLLRHIVMMTALTDMKLTPQEEYLLTQAFSVSHKRRISPERGDMRMRRSKISIRNPSRESLGYNKAGETFGFKPFASKHVVMLSSKGGIITCELEGQRHCRFGIIDEEKLNFAFEIIEDIIDKVEETAFTKFDIERNDFEVIAYPNQDIESKYGSVDLKMEEIGNSDMEGGDAGHFEGAIEDVLQVIDDDDEELMDSDGLVNDKLLAQSSEQDKEAKDETKIGDVSQKNISVSDDSSNNNNYVWDDVGASNSDKSPGNNLSASSESVRPAKSTNSVRFAKSLGSVKSSFSSGSNTTLVRMPSKEEISIESLLRYLRKKNESFKNFPEMADVD